MAESMKVPQQETPESYVTRVRDLIDGDRIGGARKLIAEAWKRFPDHPALIPWRKALSRGEVVKVGGPLDVDRTPEFRWLDAHGPEYKGEWVAVLGDRLIAHAARLKDLDARLDEQQPMRISPLVVRIQDC